MDKRMMDKQLEQLVRQSLGLSQEREDGLWADFVARAARETEAWAAFAMGLALFSRRLRAAMSSSVFPDRFLCLR